MTTPDYQTFIASKHVRPVRRGFNPSADLGPHLFPWQRQIVRWACDLGSAALFLDTGLGKTHQQLAWADQVCRHARDNVLILCPLAVAQQTKREGEKFGYRVNVARKQADCMPGINVTNYEMLEHFDPKKFAGVVLDESSVLKNYAGKVKRQILETFAATPYKLACTATPAPNDHLELGNHAEFLGVMPSNEMISRWFINDTIKAGGYRLKGHAAADFWRWVASWAVSIQKPSDLSPEYSDEGYVLPSLRMHEEVVDVDVTADAGDRLFRDTSLTATNIHKEMRRTATERAKAVFLIVNNSIATSKPAIIDPCHGEIDGNRSTLTQDGRNTTPIPSNGQSVSHTHAPPKRIASTCKLTTPPTRKSGSCLANRETSETANAASGMPPIPTTESDVSKKRSSKTPGPKSKSASGIYEPPTESRPQNTTPCSPVMAVSAQSANKEMATGENSGSTSIIATKQDASEGSCAAPATLESENSITIHTCSDLRPITASRNDPWLIWCHTNYEQDALEEFFKDEAISIYGSDSPTVKERGIYNWIDGQRRILISKPSIFGAGLNLQHCHKMAFVGLSFSYESMYQSIRRCWRFGQQYPVDVYVVRATTEGAILKTIREKEAAHRQMQTAMVQAMREATSGTGDRALKVDAGGAELVRPGWLKGRTG